MPLVMMPIDTVLLGYDEIRNEAQQLPGPPIEPLLNYFEKQWLSDIDLWNVSTTSSRNNNVREGKRKIESISKAITVLSH